MIPKPRRQSPGNDGGTSNVIYLTGHGVTDDHRLDQRLLHVSKLGDVFSSLFWWERTSKVSMIPNRLGWGRGGLQQRVRLAARHGVPCRRRLTCIFLREVGEPDKISSRDICRSCCPFWSLEPVWLASFNLRIGYSRLFRRSHLVSCSRLLLLPSLLLVACSQRRR